MTKHTTTENIHKANVVIKDNGFVFSAENENGAENGLKLKQKYVIFG